MGSRKHVAVIASLLVAFVLVVLGLVACAPAQKVEKTPISGTWGSCAWERDEDVLVVHPGEGVRHADFNWNEVLAGVKRVHLDDGVVLPSDCSRMFYDCEDVEVVESSGWDTSGVTNMSCMFSGCSSLTGVDVAGWDTTNVTDLRYLFSGCSSLAEVDVSGWDTSCVTDMRNMFEGCSSLAKVDVAGWNTSRVTGMRSMFEGCSSPAGVDVAGWDTSSVTNMRTMFSGCVALETIDLSGWDTSRATDMKYMLDDCPSLGEIRTGTSFRMKSHTFPKASNEEGKWYSTQTGQWFAPEQIETQRSGMADVYVLKVPS